MKTFNQIAYNAPSDPASAYTGQNLYNPIRGSFIIGTRSIGLEGSQFIYFFPSNDYSSLLTDGDMAKTFTNLELKFVKTFTINESGFVDDNNHTFITFFSTRNLPESNNLPSSDQESVPINDTSTNPLSFNINESYFKLDISYDEELGGLSNLGLYKGTFTLF